MNNRELTQWYVHQLTGHPETVVDWRLIHDKDKGSQAHTLRGSLGDVHEQLLSYNQQGWGVFAAINQLDGQGRELSNVQHIRAHVVDLDNLITAQVNSERAAVDGASFAVQSSPGKYHMYWKVQPYAGNDFYTMVQRKLAQYYDGDRSIIDATRVMRVPGFLHCKSDPHLVSCWDLSCTTYTSDDMQTMLQSVNVFDHLSTRSPLGETSMQAPSLEWLQFALTLSDPNDMDRGEWLSMSAAIKQSGWNHTDEETLYGIWREWCDRYSDNDSGENRKLWDSIKDTEVGWTSIERRTTVKAYMDFGFKEAPVAPQPAQPAQSVAANQTSQPVAPAQYGEILSEYDCKEYFKDCYFVNRMGEIFSQAGRFMNATRFNGRYGGKQFIITSQGKITDEPWKAALRSTCWTVPKVDHVRFLPGRPTFEVVDDALGRPGLNTYIPAKINAVEGDVSLWLDHVQRILPDAGDRDILMAYMAHCVKYPGHKIPWAPLLQSAEGIGKTVFFDVMQHALGDMYVYSPKAPELVNSGSTFNAWMRGKLLIVVNEIKIDERRELIEILKPMITDNRVEIQSKGVDQDMEDNPANWLFFSNYKDAIPISQNGRRYSIFYSALQSKSDILDAGMDDVYFNRLWPWLREGGGLEAIAHWLLNYPIECGGIPVRAPETSSHAEALRISRSPMEVVISECVEDALPGFCGGYVSSLGVIARARAAGIRSPNSRTVQGCLEGMGYVQLGRASRAYMQEDVSKRTEVYGLLSSMSVDGFAAAQGFD